MPILPLPENTAKHLGSALVITSPALLLKELLDNAIDAGATSLDVLVASNTVDRIEVRDNGHGISPEDFDSLGRPGHTSKLNSLGELDTLGGRTLGFRGAALASINTLADVSITTRMATEHVATVITLAKGGGVATRSHAASPVGTTIRATNLFSNLPVRQRSALRDAQKSLDSMKNYLRAYAFARPSVRLRFTVLQNPGLSWSYAPAANGTVKEVALQLFGMDLVSQCTFLAFPGNHYERYERYPNLQDNECSPRQGGDATFEVLLPGAGADPLKISKGAFVSVDGRPISTALGTAKTLNLVFRRCIENHFVTTASKNLPKEPFIAMNIRCPPGAYDVNIEPSKEDVLFRNEDVILGQLESFLSLIYSPSGLHGSNQPTRAEIGPGAEAGVEQSSKGPCGSHPPQVVTFTQTQPEPCRHPQAEVQAWRVDMSAVLDGESESDTDSIGHDISQCTQWQVQEDREEEIIKSPSKEGLNPWSIAKLARTKRNDEPSTKGVVQGSNYRPHAGTPASGSVDSTNVISQSTTRGKISGTVVESVPGSEKRLEDPPSQGQHLQDGNSHKHHSPPSCSGILSSHRLRPRHSYGLRSPPTSSPHEWDRLADVREHHSPHHTTGPGYLVQDGIVSGKGSRRRKHRDRPRANHNEQSSELTLSGIWRMGAAPRQTQRKEQVHTAGQIVTRNIGQTRRFQQPRRPLTDCGPGTSGHAASIHSRTTGPTDNAVPQSTQLQHLGMHVIEKGNKRLEVDQLPLETIPQCQETCTLSLTVKVDARSLAQLAAVASQYDAWLVDGELRGAFQHGGISQDVTGLIDNLLARIGQGRFARA